MELTRDDAGTTATARTGEAVVVRLPENPTTGYRWQPDVDPSALELSDDTYEGATRPVGAGGERVLTFTVLREGPTRLHLVRRRSWETTPVEEFTVELDVRPG